MHVAAAMILLLCCGVVASSAANINDVALADDDAVLKGHVTALLTIMKALERRASEPDSVKPEGQEDFKKTMLLNAIQDAFARWGTPNCSDNGGLPSQQLSSKISEQVTQMGAEFRAEIRVLKDQSAADAQTLRNMTRQLERATQDGGASTFVRWGSSTCGGNASSLVYSGVVGGSWFQHTGAAVNYLCLTLSPRLSQQAPLTAHALLYGAEYETEDSHHSRNPVCAVCRAASSTTVMIPGTDSCTPGWRLQYSGFLMAGKHDHPAATEYICVDLALESANRGARNDNGALLHFTKTVCGSLPCAPYVNDKIVTCAVCSK